MPVSGFETPIIIKYVFSNIMRESENLNGSMLVMYCNTGVCGSDIERLIA